MLSHTYLFQPGRWRAEGAFIDASQARSPATGVTDILHQTERWIVTSVMRSVASPAAESRTRYEVEPHDGTTPVLEWASMSPTMGLLTGTFAIVDDSILSLYRSRDGGYRGSETYRRISDAEYDCAGALLRGRRLLSSWRVRLVREPD